MKIESTTETPRSQSLNCISNFQIKASVSSALSVVKTSATQFSFADIRVYSRLK